MTSTKHHFAESPLPVFEVFSETQASKVITHDGQKLRERFVNGGADAVPDDEMLELLLLRVVASHEVRALSRRLLKIFGDFNRVISATPQRLKEVLGVSDSIVLELKIVEASAQRMAQGRVMQREVLSCWTALLEYCQIKMANLDTEQFHVLYLDKKNVLIADEAQQKGTVDHVPVYPREVIKRALELNASAIILVHNHPSGDTNPSQEDITMTQTIQTGADTLGITVHDHLIIGQMESFSFRSHNLL